jgi:hypothetical protein
MKKQGRRVLQSLSDAFSGKRVAVELA